MNTPRHDIDAREWAAQEDALSAPVRRADAVLVRALRTPPASQPPADFAASVARLAQQGAPVAAREESPAFDRWLLNALLAVFALAAAVVVALYGPQWWAMSGRAIGTAATQWGLAGAACLALSWAMGSARRLVEATHGDPA